MDSHGNLIVTDFGFANQFTQKTGDLMSTSCGSPVYAAPELVMTGTLYAGTGVDIWSCGIILYAMLCGYLPFDDDIKNPNGDNIGRLYRYIMANKPKYPAHLSDDSKDIIGKMLIPDPNSRCKVIDIMNHPWLSKYKTQITKPIQELELEGQILKQSLLKGFEPESIQVDDDYVEDVCCDQDEDVQSSACSARSSASSTYSFPPSYSNTKRAQNDDNMIIEEHQDQHSIADHVSSPPTTPIPCAKDINSLTETIEEFPTAITNDQSSSKSTKEPTTTDAVTIPVAVPQSSSQIQESSSNIQKAGISYSSSSVNVNKKRHTISTSASQDTNMPSIQHSSLRAKLFSSVKRRNHSETVIKQDTVKEGQLKKKNNRNSWQQIIHRHTHNNNNHNTFPASPPSSPIMPEQSKSVRLISWLKTKTHHKKCKYPRHLSPSPSPETANLNNTCLQIQSMMVLHQGVVVVVVIVVTVVITVVYQLERMRPFQLQGLHPHLPLYALIVELLPHYSKRVTLLIKFR